MKFKLDENFGNRTEKLFAAAGHDVRTIRQQALQGCSDDHLCNVCCSEKRCLVTLDLDFADVTRFPPEEANGMVVIRIPRNPTITLLEQLIAQFLRAVQEMSVAGDLWIVEPGRIRIHQKDI